MPAMYDEGAVRTSHYSEFPSETFNYAHPDSGFVDSSVLEAEVEQARLSARATYRLQPPLEATTSDAFLEN